MTPFGDDPDTNLLLIRARWERTLEEAARGRPVPAAEKDEHLGRRRSRLSRLGRSIVAQFWARAPRVNAPARPAETEGAVLALPVRVCQEAHAAANHSGERFSCECGGAPAAPASSV